MKKHTWPRYLPSKVITKLLKIKATQRTPNRKEDDALDVPLHTFPVGLRNSGEGHELRPSRIEDEDAQMPFSHATEARQEGR